MLRAFLSIQRLSFTVLVGSMTLVAAPKMATADPPWAKLVPFKKVDADPGRNYELEEQHGPWMILAASFVGHELPSKYLKAHLGKKARQRRQRERAGQKED